MRLARLEINHGYTIDLDNPEMIAHAKDAILDDFRELYKHDDELLASIKIVRMKGLKKSDIPEFLTEDLDAECT